MSATETRGPVLIVAGASLSTEWCVPLAGAAQSTASATVVPEFAEGRPVFVREQ